MPLDRIKLKKPIVYITPDPEKGTGVEDFIDNYFILCPFESPLSWELKEKGKCIILEEILLKKRSRAKLSSNLNSSQILDFQETQKILKQLRPSLLFLKNSSLVEEKVKKLKLKILGPKSSLVDKYENKISQYLNLKSYLPFPDTKILKIKELENLKIKKPLILQFNRGHSGNTTFLLTSKNQKKLFQKFQNFPQREVRVSEYIKGETFTLNCLLTKRGFLYLGSLSFQITGEKKLTKNKFSTVGNDWGKARKKLKKNQVEIIKKIAEKLARILRKEKYWGFFGIDVIVERKSGKIYFLEINSHIPASVPFESRLHLKLGKFSLFYIFFKTQLTDDKIKNKFLPPILLPFPAYQKIYRNKNNFPLKEKDIQYPVISYQKGEKLLKARKKIIYPNEEMYRIYYGI